MLGPWGFCGMIKQGDKRQMAGQTEYPSLSNFPFGTLAPTFTFVQIKNVSATQGVHKNMSVKYHLGVMSMHLFSHLKLNTEMLATTNGLPISSSTKQRQ